MPASDEAAIGTSIYEISSRTAVPQTQSDRDSRSRAPMGSSAISTPSAPENPPAPIAVMFHPPPAPVNPPAPVAARCPPPLPTRVPSSIPNPPPIPAPPVPPNPSAGSVGRSPTQISANEPFSDRIYNRDPVDSSNSGGAHLSTSIFPKIPSVPTSPPSRSVPSSFKLPSPPTAPSSAPNRERVASSEAMQL